MLQQRQKGNSKMLKNPREMRKQTISESHGAPRTLTAAEIAAVAGSSLGTSPKPTIPFPQPSPTFPPIEIDS
jgi:hypothetical protein